jgi:hypothetical protein
LVEVSQGQPTDALRRLLSNKLGEEVVLAVRRRRTIDPSDLEIAVDGRIDDVHIRGQAKLRGDNV